MTSRWILASLGLLFSTALGLFSQPVLGADDRFTSSVASVVQTIPRTSLTDAETRGILLMREEEKLARDVYTTLAATWNIRSFSNIAASEQTHMDAVKLLLDRYGIADPIKSDTLGVFTDPRLKTLYDELVARGKTSAEEAVEVGALIEELDIADLQRLTAQTDNDDVKVVYQNLAKGSRNHLRSFTSQVNRYGATYQPQHISSAEYARIVSTRNETGGPITDPTYRF